MHKKFIIPYDSQRNAIVASVFVDAVIFNFTIVVGYLLCGIPFGVSLFDSESFRAYMELYWLAFLMAPIGYYFAGLYARDPYRLLVRSLEKSFVGTVIAVILVLVVTYVFRAYLTDLSVHEHEDITTEKLQQLTWGLSSSVLLFAIILGPCLIALWRFTVNRIENKIIGWSNRPQNLLIIGYLNEGDIERLKGNYCPAYNIKGFIPVGAEPEHSGDLNVLGNIEDLSSILEEHEIDEVMVVSTYLSRDKFFDIISYGAEFNIRVWMVSDIFETIISAVNPVIRKNVPLFEIRDSRITGWPLVIKRIIDVVVSAIVLIITFPFFILPACVAIVIDSKGFPVFTQNRVGLNGEIFKLYKLRTMVIDADARGGALTADNDPRITKFGKFLRRTSIDELPQLWNVLKGDMSIIGPRAVIPFVADRFEDWERISLNVKPGLTGLAQISGRDEVGFKEKSLLNLYYVRNYSLWLDLRILFSTILVVLSMEGTAGTRQNG